MANEKHLAILNEALEKHDISIWNQWRYDNPGVRPDLSRENRILSNANLNIANLSSTDLSRANLSGTNLVSANLIEANFSDAKLVGADLSGAILRKTNLIRAHVIGANLSKAVLFGADLSEARLSRADLTKADLRKTLLVQTDFTNATLEGCHVYGISAWDIKLHGAVQKDLRISQLEEISITVDNLKVAQFIYLLLNNAEIRDVIDTITIKAVLILGRFTPERKAVLDAIREDLRTRGFLPILFDFEKPSSRDLTETVRTLAHLSRFVIADLTEPSSIPHELANIVPQLPSVPVKPIILEGNHDYTMIENLYRYPWMLPAHEYKSQATLIAELAEKVIQPAQDKAEEMKPRPLIDI